MPATPATTTDRDQRLEEIQRKLESLVRELQTLRAPLPTTKPISPPSTATVPRTPISVPAGGKIELPRPWLESMVWRPIGPANMGGRITDLAVSPSDPSLLWIATASGGLLKTVNNGVTFEHQFDREATVSIGAIAVAPSDTNIVWVGTGEANPRNSVSYGDGVYKSTDGGKTWQNMGLAHSYQIGRIVVHPRNPDVVYVGALGRLYGANEERGLFKSTDGGKTWERVLHVDDKTGVIDLIMHPTDPETLIAATWERQRDEFDSWPGKEVPIPDGYDGYDPIKKWGPGGGLHKSTDGGKTWKRITQGLPTSPLGRIGLDWHRQDPRIVYAIVDCEAIGKGPPPSPLYLGLVGINVDGKARVTQVLPESPAAKAGLQPEDIILAIGESPVSDFDQVLEATNSAKPGAELKFKVQRGEATLDVSPKVTLRPGQGPLQQPTVWLGVQGETRDGKAVLTEILDDSPAARAALMAGDIVVEAEGKPVADYAALVREIRARKAGDKLKLKVRRGEESLDAEVTLENRSTGSSRSRPHGASLGGQPANIQDQQGAKGYEYGGVYKSVDGGETWQRVNSLNSRPMYFSTIRVDPNDPQRVYVLGVAQYQSTNGGVTFDANLGRGVHADGHALWINPRDGRHLIHGGDGGVYVSYDRGANWDHWNHAAIAQFYHVAISLQAPYHLTGGLQDNGTWMGPNLGRSGQGPINEDWLNVNGGDGFQCQVDREDPDWVYYTSQNGTLGRRNMRTGQRASIRPTVPRGAPPYRFNWNTPFLLSNHAPRVFYTAGNVVFRSVNRGENLQVISPEIAITRRGSATALAESPRNPDVLYVGTDDGGLWGTRDGGKQWVDLFANVGLPARRWVASIEASRFEEGRVYVAFDGHRSDDDAPYAFVSEDFGKSWKAIHANLPRGSTRVLREDLESPNLLYLGSEFHAWCSLDRGQHWNKLNTNLPTVAIHEFAQHPTTGEIVAATHGRSLWIADVTALRQIRPEHLAGQADLLQPGVAVRWQRAPTRGGTNRRFIGVNPPSGAPLHYVVPVDAKDVSLQVFDTAGTLIRSARGNHEPGLHRLVWDLTRAATPARAPSSGPTEKSASARPGTESSSSGRATGRNSVGFQGQSGRSVASGTYRVVLQVDGVEYSRLLRVEPDPTLPPAVVALLEKASGGDAESNEQEASHSDDEREEQGERYERASPQPIGD